MEEPVAAEGEAAAEETAPAEVETAATSTVEALAEAPSAAEASAEATAEASAEASAGAPEEAPVEAPAGAPAEVVGGGPAETAVGTGPAETSDEADSSVAPAEVPVADPAPAPSEMAGADEVSAVEAPIDDSAAQPEAAAVSEPEASEAPAAPFVPPEPKAPKVYTPDPAVRLKAAEELKAAVMRAAAAKPLPKPATEALLTFCTCIQALTKDPDVGPVRLALYQALPKLGESFLAPFLGVKRHRARPQPAAPANISANMCTGKVKSYNMKKGFGFIDMPGQVRDIFVYNIHLIGRISLVAGQAVEFELVMDNDRPQARKVKVVKEAQAAMPGAVTNGRSVGTTAPVQQPPAPALPSNARLNPLGAMEEAMSMPPPSNAQDVRDMALAMAAAAAEVPTTLPQQRRPFNKEADTPEKANGPEDLFHTIRAAQTAAASDKRKPAKPEPNESKHDLFGGFPTWQDSQQQAQAAAAAVAAEHAAEMEIKFTDEGRIPRNATVRVVNFPATEVNDCRGVVQGYDAATQRYSVAVDMRKGSGNSSGETVPFQFKEEYLQVESLPMERPRPIGSAAAASAAAAAASSSMPVPELPPGANPQSNALRKSASEALKRFEQHIAMAPQPAAGQWLSPAAPGPGPGAASAAAMAGAMQMAGKGSYRPPFAFPGPGGGPGYPGGPGGPPGGPPGGFGMPPPAQLASAAPGGPYARAAVAAAVGAGPGPGGGPPGGPPPNDAASMRNRSAGSMRQQGHPAQAKQGANMVPPGPGPPGQMQGPGGMPMQSKAPGGPHGAVGQGGQMPQRGLATPQRERPPQRGPQSPPRMEAEPRGPQQPARQPGPVDGSLQGQQRQAMRSPERRGPPAQAPGPAGRGPQSPGSFSLGMAPGGPLASGQASPPRPPAGMGVPLEQLTRMSSGPKATSMTMPASDSRGPPPKAMQQGPSQPPGREGQQAGQKAAPQPAPEQPKARQRGPHVSEGANGTMWQVMRSENFEDVLVRETKEVTGKVLRRVQPDEILEQRGPTIENESGLVRMPVAPAGWVTVHARNIGGPTFMTIIKTQDMAQAVSAAQRVKAAAAKAPQQQQLPRSTQSPPPKAKAQSSQQQHAKAPPPAATAAPSPGHSKVPPARPATALTSPPRERPSPAKARPGEDTRQIGPSRDGRTSPPMSRPDPAKAKAPAVSKLEAGAPWQDGDDPWSKSSSADPWSKAQADPWAQASAPAAKAARGTQAARPPPSKAASTASQPASSTVASAGDRSGPSYSREDMLRVRGAFQGHPAQLPIRTIRIPTLEAGAPAKRRDRERSTKRPADDEDRPQPGGASADFLRRQSPARETRDSSSQQRPGLPLARGPGAAAQSGDAAAVGAGNATGASPDRRAEQKPKEETKANCPTQ